jgi:hypothetical protein
VECCTFIAVVQFTRKLIFNRTLMLLFRLIACGRKNVSNVSVRRPRRPMSVALLHPQPWMIIPERESFRPWLECGVPDVPYRRKGGAPSSAFARCGYNIWTVLFYSNEKGKHIFSHKTTSKNAIVLRKFEIAPSECFICVCSLREKGHVCIYTRAQSFQSNTYFYFDFYLLFPRVKCE